MIYLFDHSENLVRVLTEKHVLQARWKRERTGMRTLSLTLPLKLQDGTKVSDILGQAETVGHYDKEDRFQLYYINNIRGNLEHMLTCVHVAHDELKSEEVIRDVKFRGALPGPALDRILQGTRWQRGVVEVDTSADYNIYYQPAADAFEKYESRHGAELDFRIEFDGQRITGRYVDALKRLGRDTSKRFVHGHNTLKVEREEVREIYTALIGRGKGEEIFDEESGESTGGYGRRIGFEGITWTYPDGRIKPVGQDYVELPVMTARYGHTDGKPRIRVEIFEETDNPYVLVEETYARLVELSRPQVLYSASVTDVGDVRLGDTVSIIRKDLGIAFRTRIEVEERDLLNDRLSELLIGDWGFFRKDKKQEKTDKAIDRIENSIEDVVSQTSTKIEQTDEQIRLEARNREDQIAAINLRADEIVISVEEANKSIAAVNLRADGIVSRVENLDDNLGEAWSEIRQHSDEIDARVVKDGVIAAINLSPELIKLDASKIQMSGITEVAGRLQVGNASNPATRLEFYNGGMFQPYIEIGNGVYGSGLELFASDLHLSGADHIYIGTTATDEVYAYGEWDWSGATHKNLTAVAALG